MSNICMYVSHAPPSHAHRITHSTALGVTSMDYTQRTAQFCSAGPEQSQYLQGTIIMIAVTGLYSR